METAWRSLDVLGEGVLAHERFRDESEPWGDVAGSRLVPQSRFRWFFVEASRAYYQHILQNAVANPLMVEPDRATESFFGLGIARDAVATRSFADLYSRATAGRTDVDPKLIRKALHWGVANVLVAHATGASLADAAKRLKSILLPKTIGAKVGAILEALREVALECATGKPDPTTRLRKLAEANAAIGGTTTSARSKPICASEALLSRASPAIVDGKCRKKTPIPACHSPCCG